jgi:hypothetical protein
VKRRCLEEIDDAGIFPSCGVVRTPEWSGDMALHGMWVDAWFERQVLTRSQRVRRMRSFVASTLSCSFSSMAYFLSLLSAFPS